MGGLRFFNEIGFLLIKKKIQMPFYSNAFHGCILSW
jgi:hypothetical protein